MALVCAPGLLLASRMYTLYKKEGSLPLPSVKKTLAAMVGVLLPRNLPAAAYSLLTLAFAGMSAMCLSATPGEVMKFYPGLHGKRARGSRQCSCTSRRSLALLQGVTLGAPGVAAGAWRGRCATVTPEKACTALCSLQCILLDATGVLLQCARSGVCLKCVI